MAKRSKTPQKCLTIFIICGMMIVCIFTSCLIRSIAGVFCLYSLQRNISMIFCIHWDVIETRLGFNRLFKSVVEEDLQYCTSKTPIHPFTDYRVRGHTHTHTHTHTHIYIYTHTSSRSSGQVRGARKMKSMRLPLAAIFFMTYFHRAGGAMAPSAPPPGSATGPLHSGK